MNIIESTVSRILIVGMGSIGKRHIGIINKLFPDMSIAVFRHKKCSEQFKIAGIDCCVSSIKDALKFKPQAAIVANPASHHLNTAVPLAKAGIHLLIEKPISITNEGLDNLINICNEKNIILMTGYNLRFLPSLQVFRRYLNEEKVGKSLSVRAEVGQYLPNWRNDSDYRNTVSAQKILGGGVLLELSHEIDYLLWLFGRIDWVDAHISKQSNLEIDVEDTAHIILGFDKNSRDYQLTASLNLDFIRHDTTRSCTVIGDKGSLKWNGINGSVEIFKENGSQWETIFLDKPERNYTYEKEVQHFFKCIEKKEKPLIAGEEGKACIDVIDAIRNSSKNSKKVNLKQAIGNSQ